MRTDITFLLDRSGSMGPLVDDTIGGFNSLIAEQKLVDGEAAVSLYQFDNEFIINYEGVDINNIKDLNSRLYIPRGATALLDAMAKSIALTEERLVEKPADKVIFVIITDGQENASKEVNKSQVKELIKRLQKTNCGECGQEKGGGWEFVFAGANMDAISEAGSMGISGSASLSYSADSQGLRTMYADVSRAVGISREQGSDGSVSFD